MKFTVLRLLTHSELGMFHAYRASGREGSRQRAINFDWDVVDRIFPSAGDQDRILITCRCLEDATSVVVKDQWLKKQEKNWRLEGYCPQSPYYEFVQPGVLFAMVVDSSNTPASASWVVIPQDHPAGTAITNHGESSKLAKSSMIALYGDEGDFCQSILAEHFPQLFDRVESTVSIENTDYDRDEAPPDPLGLFKILARAGHSLPSAVADLVDNSLSKDAHEIDITFPNPNQGGRWMCIRDDGVGMTPSALRDAMKIGHQRDYEAADLGKYGYGLKGAAFSQADRLTVISKTVDSPESILTWDREHLARTRRWALLSDPVGAEHAEVTQLEASGTAVLLTQMRPPLESARGRAVDPYAQEVASIRDHLELVFHRFLEGTVPGRQKVTIRLHTSAGVTELRPNNPIGHPLTKTFDPRTIELQGHVIPSMRPTLTVQAFITPTDAEFSDYHKAQPPEEVREARDRLTLNGRANDSQGFYFYRLNRLIKWGGWEDLFAKDEHTKLIRVAVDFNRLADDQLQVDISKQLIRLPVAITDSLKEILKAPRSEARARYDKKPGSAGGAQPKNGGAAAGSSGPAAGGPSATGGKKSSTTPGSGAAVSSKKSPVRLVEGMRTPWERVTGFTGEVVEISESIPQLVTLVQTIDGSNEAKTALSEFLRVLEQAGVVPILSGKPDEK
jgi:hypothetical protein